MPRKLYHLCDCRKKSFIFFAMNKCIFVLSSQSSTLRKIHQKTLLNGGQFSIKMKVWDHKIFTLEKQHLVTA